MRSFDVDNKIGCCRENNTPVTPRLCPRNVIPPESVLKERRKKTYDKL